MQPGVRMNWCRTSMTLLLRRWRRPCKPRFLTSVKAASNHSAGRQQLHNAVAFFIRDSKPLQVVDDLLAYGVFTQAIDRVSGF